MKDYNLNQISIFLNNVVHVYCKYTGIQLTALSDTGKDFKEMHDMTAPLDASRGQREPAFNQF